MAFAMKDRIISKVGITGAAGHGNVRLTISYKTRAAPLNKQERL